MTSPITYYIAAAVVNSFTYGVLCILFVVSMFLLGHWSTSSRSSIYLKPVILASILLFLVVTAHWAVTIYRLFKALAGTTQNAVAFVLDIFSPSNVAAMSLVFLSGAIGDFIIIYRVWIIWGCNHVVVMFPICSAIGESVAFVGLVYQLIKDGATLDASFFTSWNRWIVAACVFTVCTNVYCSGFIMWRLWRSHQRNIGSGGDSIIRAAIMVIESAALYTSWAILFFASYEADKGPGIYMFAATAWPPITGIAIMLINARVGLGRVQKLKSIPAHPTSSFKFNHSNGDISPHSVNFIRITRTVDVDGVSQVLSAGESGIAPLS